MLVDFAVVIGIASDRGTWQNKQLPNVPLSHNNHERNADRFCRDNWSYFRSRKLAK
jgi:hypothetical protein